MNWGRLGAAVIGNVPNIVRLVEGIRGRRAGVDKQNLAVDLFFSMIASQEESNIVDRIEYAEDEVRGMINAFVALENKLSKYEPNA